MMSSHDSDFLACRNSAFRSFERRRILIPFVTLMSQHNLKLGNSSISLSSQRWCSFTLVSSNLLTDGLLTTLLTFEDLTEKRNDGTELFTKYGSSTGSSYNTYMLLNQSLIHSKNNIATSGSIDADLRFANHSSPNKHSTSINST